uniref:Uncharacterized protein n=1 Tax=Ixodes ricinus TaxID=34613 RepID=A0A0K8R6Q6_IXORI
MLSPKEHALVKVAIQEGCRGIQMQVRKPGACKSTTTANCQQDKLHTTIDTLLTFRTCCTNFIQALQPPTNAAHITDASEMVTNEWQH